MLRENNNEENLKIFLQKRKLYNKIKNKAKSEYFEKEKKTLTH